MGSQDLRQYVLGKLPRVDGRIGYAPGVETLEDKGCAGLAQGCAGGLNLAVRLPEVSDDF